MRKRGIFKRLGATTILMVMLSLPILVFASSYTSSLEFDSTLTGAKRSFSGSDISMSIDAYSYQNPGSATLPASSTFKAQLIRYHSILKDDYLSTVYYERDGFTGWTWTNVGSGTYYWYFSKAIDGWTVKADSGDVVMFN